MSKYKDCQLFVDANGKYCCGAKRMCVGDGNCLQISLIGTGPVDLLFYPSGDTDETPMVHSTLDEGLNLITDCGTFKLDFDCAAFDGVVAPTDPAAQAMICCTIKSKDDMGLVVSILQQLCDKLLLSDDSSALATIVTQLEEVCKKLLTNGSTQTMVLAEILALCDKINEGNTALLSVISELQSLCKKLLETNEKLSDFTEIMSDIKDLLTCPPATAKGLLTAWG